MDILDSAKRIMNHSTEKQKIRIYEEALKEIAAACNPGLKAECPRIAREALFKAKELIR